jgi:hypothetical protein
MVSPKRHTSYFVQFAGQGPSGLRAETVGNGFLDESEQLDAVALTRLTAIGWRPPTSSPAPDGAPGGDPDGSPNHYRDWEPPVPYEQVAAMAVDTLVGIFDVSHPGLLCYRAFARGGAQILLPTLAISPAKNTTQKSVAPTPTEDTSSIRRQLDAALKEFLGAEEIKRDEDGDVPIRFGSAMVYVRLSDEPPRISVFAPMLGDVPGTAQLLESVNEVNGNVCFVRAVWNGRMVSLRCELPARPFVAEHTLNAVAAVGSLADQIGEELQGRFGGRTYFGPALPPAHDFSSAGYL